MFSSSVCMVQPMNWSPCCPPPSVPTPTRTPAVANRAMPRDSRVHDLVRKGRRLCQSVPQSLDLLRPHAVAHQGVRRIDPGRMHLPPQPAEREHEERIRLSFQQIHQLVVDIADHVREPVHPGARQRLDVHETRRMDHHPHLALMRLVDDRLVERWCELLDGPAARIHPGLDHLHAVGGEVRDRLAARRPRS